MPTTITGIDPVACNVLGGEEVRIDGTQINAGARVTIGGTRATVVGSTPPNQIVVTAPSRALAGLVPVTITNTDGTTVTVAGGFEYVAQVLTCAPEAVTASGGTALTITGKGFVAGMSVEIDGTDVGAIVIVSPTQITCTAPAHGPGGVHVDVLNPGGAQGGRWGTFHYSAPLVTGVLPRAVPLAGGTDIRLRGKYFGAGATVDIDGNAALNVIVVSDTEITCQTPAHAAGAVDVQVTVAGEIGTLAGGLTYVGGKATKIRPARGPVAGGTDIIVSGERFLVGVTLQIGGVDVVGLTRVDDHTLTARTPALAAGPHDVVAQNLGEAVSTLAGSFVAVGTPAATGVEPKRGPVAGGTAITVTGAGFVNGAEVRVGGVLATNIVVASATAITATTPAHAAGAVNVEVKLPDGAPSTLAGAFTYSRLISVLPNRGPAAGGTAVVIRGDGFPVTPLVVDVGGQPATGVQRISATEIHATTPAHAAGPVDVSVTKASDGFAAAFSGGFTYSPLISAAPGAGPLAGATDVTLRGGPFPDGTTVSFGGNAAAAVVHVSDQELTATSPIGGAVGPVDLIVHHDGGLDATFTDGFTYRAAATITAVDPPLGPEGGRTVITITGTGFLPGATVNVGVGHATNVRVISATTIIATTPLGPPPALGAAVAVHRVCNVEVTNPGELAVIGAGLYSYRLALDVVAVNPARGPVGGRWVTITGHYFAEGAVVYMSGVALPGAERIDAQTLRIRLPAHAVGSVYIDVQNPDGESGRRLDAFAYVATSPETSDNEVIFLLDGENYFEALRTHFDEVRQAERNPLTYVRLAFWMIEPGVTLGDRRFFEKPDHRLLAYIEQVVRAGHDVDVIAWQAPRYERRVNSLADDVAKDNEGFAAAIRELDEAAVASGPDVGRARMYLEHYEGGLVGASNHQKIVIFSIAGQRTAFVGGLNLSNHYFAPDDHDHGGVLMPWHDAAVRLRGPVTDDVEAEWMRRWKRAEDVATAWVWNAFGGGGEVVARGFAYWAKNTVKLQAVSIQQNTTRQTPHADNRTVSIALTRSDGTTRYRYIRDKMIERIRAADDYVYFENYHFTDGELVRALYERHEARRVAGHELAIVIVVPLQGGGSGYLTRRSWLQLALRLSGPLVPYCRRVHYLDESDTAQHIDRVGCHTWEVVDSYNADTLEPQPGDWLEDDCLRFRALAGDELTTVPLDKITQVEGDFHFYSCFGPHLTNIYNHAKIAAFDDRWLVCGTSNWSFRSMQYDGEIAAVIDSPHVTQAAMAALLGHYNPGRMLVPNGIQAEVVANVEYLITNSAFRDAGALTLLPLCYEAVAPLDLTRTRPGLSESPSYSWI